MRRWLRWIIGLTAATLAAGVIGLYWLVERTHPQLAGRLTLHGLVGEVVVEREPSGVVHITADNDRDLIFAQGVVHAQDRLWQMEMQRRIGAGRLSEIFGPNALERDRYLRTWGFYRAAEAALLHLGAEARGLIEAYVAGINAYLATKPPLPPEFHLLGLRPEPWRPADLLVWSKLMAYNLAQNRGTELTRYRLLARGLEPERIAELMPLYPGEVAPAATDADALRSLTQALVAPLDALIAADGRNRQHRPQASNAWAVHGSRTGSGAPLLANDIHLGLQMPSTWYLNHLSSPGFEVIGASLPGLPLVVVGRNETIAWGVTSLGADTEDIYVLDDVGAGYRYRGEIRDYAVREETILVKGGSPERIRIRESVYGPIISDGSAESAAAPLAIRSVAQDPDDTTFEAFIAINRARDFTEFRAALASHYVVPGQGFVYADRAGHIGYSASGRIPTRRQGHSGLYPVPGGGDWDWTGYLPRSELPSRVDPDAGYVVSANQRTTELGYQHRISLEWGDEPYRAQRIDALLDSRARHDLSSMSRIQLDTKTLLYSDLRDIIAALEPDSLDARRWQLRLLAWDGHATTESVAATVFFNWYGALAGLPTEETGTAQWRGYPRYLIGALNGGDPACERRGMGCRVFAATALERILERLGPNPGAWGEHHRARFEQAGFGSTPLGALTNRELGVPGSAYTVNAGGYRSDDWTMVHGPSYRQIIDLADPERSVFVIAGGQSGNWFAKTYADQLSDWQEGRYLPMRRSGYPVEHRLVLVPEGFGAVYGDSLELTSKGYKLLD